MRFLKIAGLVFLVLLAIAGAAYALRTDPIGPISGKRLSGPEVTEPVTDWSFTDQHPLIAIETRPSDPHSVTVVCFTHQGALYVPASDGAEKRWPQYALDDPSVRLKIGDRVYRGRATRITDETMRQSLRESAARKYAEIREAAAGEDPPDYADVWVFRIDAS